MMMINKIDNNVAYIIKRINELGKIDPGKKVLQKMIFLMVEKGIPLNYEYGLHFYGPYCASLSIVTDYLHADGIIRINYTGNTHEMTLNDNIDAAPIGLTPEHLQAIDDVIDNFVKMSPSELELLTTAIYAHTHLEDKSKKSVVGGVQKIKGEKYAPDMIYNSLNYFEYFEKSFSED